MNAEPTPTRTEPMTEGAGGLRPRGVDAMIGTRLESRSGTPIGAIAWLLLAALLVAGAVAAGNIRPAVGALLPAAIGLALILARPNPFAATVGEHGLILDDPRRRPGDDAFGPADDRPGEGQPTLAYEEIQGLFPVGRARLTTLPGPQRFEIRASHPGGVVRIPKRLNASSDDLYRFLTERVPDRGSRDVNPALAAYLKQNEAAFGPERVWSYAAASHLAVKPPMTGLRAGSIAALLVGVLWIVGGVYVANNRGIEDGKAWAGAGGFVAIFGGLFWLVSYATSADRATSLVKKWRQASLVITPVGLALVQGDIQGEVTWGELRDVRLQHRKGGSFHLESTAALNGILLKIAGADIVIADIYDRPLHIIYERIRNYWRE